MKSSNQAVLRQAFTQQAAAFESSRMDLTAVPNDTRKAIIQLMEQELCGGEKTGFGPYLRGDALTFDQRWLLVIGQAQG